MKKSYSKVDRMWDMSVSEIRVEFDKMIKRYVLCVITMN